MSSSYTITIIATVDDNNIGESTDLVIYDKDSFEEEVQEFLTDSNANNWRIDRVGNHVPEQAGEFIAHFIKDGALNPKFWEWQELMERSALAEEVWEAAYELRMPPDKVEEAYEGTYNSDSDYAYEYAERTGAIDQEIRWPYTSIDWQQAAKDLDFTEENGHYFNNNW